MIRKYLHIAWTILFLVSAQLAFSQNIPNAKASVDRNQIVIGERIHLVLEGDAPPESNVDWFFFDSIPHFQIVERGKIDTVENANGKLYKQELVITSFDSGTQRLPAF